jgi:hypothetical protein
LNWGNLADLQVFFTYWMLFALFSNLQKIDTAMSNLLDYLNHLDKNADARDAHAADATGSMTNFGLSQDEQDALMSGDKQKIAAACGVSAEALPSTHIPESPY